MNLLFFELLPQVHLPEYVRALIDVWSGRERAGTLNFLVNPNFLVEHSDMVARAERTLRSKIRFLTLTAAEQAEWNKLAAEPGGMTISFADMLRGKVSDTILRYEWELYCRHAVALGASHGFIGCLDRYLVLLATGADSPVPFSGIYFLPIFHYPTFGDVHTTAALSQTFIYREKFMLTRALRAPHLETFFFLDPFAVEEAQKFPNGQRVRFLADPVTIPPVPHAHVRALRDRLGVGPDRRVFLLFGGMTWRKGIFELFQALEHMNTHSRADILKRMCILLIGRTAPEMLRELETRIAALISSSPVQVVGQFEYVSGEDAAAYFQLSDAVLVPYPQHTGSSGVLLVAAAFQKPSLVSRYGLIGELTRKYGLGLDVDVTQPAQFADALTRLVCEDASTLCDFEQMRILAAGHTPEKFAGAIFQDV